VHVLMDVQVLLRFACSDPPRNVLVERGDSGAFEPTVYADSFFGRRHRDDRSVARDPACDIAGSSVYVEWVPVTLCTSIGMATAVAIMLTTPVSLSA
jgi:hypothetical protein